MMVGLFFYVKSETLNYNDFLYYAIEEEKTEKYGKFSTTGIGHSELFDKKFPGKSVEYFDFPRGRVVFDVENNNHIIYIDNCIRSKANELAKIFDIANYILETDEHYVCKKCMSDDFFE